MKRQPNGQITMSELSSELYDDIKGAYREDTSNVHIPNISIKGRTLVNLLGRRGNAANNIVPDLGNYYGGTPSIEKNIFTFTITQDTNLSATQNCGFALDVISEKYYIAVSEIKCGQNTMSAVFGSWDPVFISDAKAYYVSDKNTFNVCYIAFKSIKTGTTPCSNIFNETKNGDINKFRNCRVYEITKREYELINSNEEYSGENIGKLYPYVDSVKPIVNPYIECNENLLTNINYIIGATNENFDIVYGEPSPYVISNRKIILQKNTTYSLNVEGGETGEDFIIQSYDGNIHTNLKGTFNTGNNNEFITVFYNQNKEYESAKSIEKRLLSGSLKVSLVKGDKPKSYDKCHNSRIVFGTTLYDGENISKRSDGKYIKNVIWDMETFSKITKTDRGLHANGSTNEFKIIRVCKLPSVEFGAYLREQGMKNGAHVILHDGQRIPYHAEFSEEGTSTKEINRLSWCVVNNPTTISYLSLILPNTLTGWGGSYSPTVEEINAFLLGWRMYLKNSPTGPKLYDGTGDKGWVKLWSGEGEIINSLTGVKTVNGSNLYSCPTTLNDSYYTPIKLIYRRMNEYSEEVTTYGSLTIKDGIDINISSGLIIKEQICADAVIGDTFYRFNRISSVSTKPKYKFASVLKINSAKTGLTYTPINTVSTASTHFLMLGDCYCEFLGKAGESDIEIDYLTHISETVTSYEFSICDQENIEELMDVALNEISNTHNYFSSVIKSVDNSIKNLMNLSNPNLLINGDFKIWQRGTSFKNQHATYTADRWFSVNYGSSAGIGTTSVDKTNEGIRLSGNWTNYNNANAYIEIIQPMEEKLKGTYTFTVKAKGVGSFVNFMYFDTRSSFYGASNIVQLTEEYSIYKLTFEVDGTKQLEPTIRLMCSMDSQLNSDLYVDIAWAKLEKGNTATELIPRTYAEELLMCQRYYEVTQLFTMPGYKSTVHDSKVIENITFKASKRISNPTITLNIIDATGTVASSKYSISYIRAEGFRLYLTNIYQTDFQANIDAEIY